MNAGASNETNATRENKNGMKYSINLFNYTYLVQDKCFPLISFSFHIYFIFCIEYWFIYLHPITSETALLLMKIMHIIVDSCKMYEMIGNFITHLHTHGIWFIVSTYIFSSFQSEKWNITTHGRRHRHCICKKVLLLCQDLPEITRTRFVSSHCIHISTVFR